MLEQLRGNEALLIFGKLGHTNAWHELGAEVEGAFVFKGVLEAREGDVGVGLEVGQDRGVGLPSLGLAGGRGPVGGCCHPFVLPKRPLDEGGSDLVVLFVGDDAGAAWFAVLVEVLVGYHF